MKALLGTSSDFISRMKTHDLTTVVGSGDKGTHTLFPRRRCWSTYYPKILVGVQQTANGKYIGSRGRRCVPLRGRAAWGSGTGKLSTRPCLPGRRGVYSLILIVYVHRCLRLATIWRVALKIMSSRGTPPLHRRISNTALSS